MTRILRLLCGLVGASLLASFSVAATTGDNDSDSEQRDVAHSRTQASGYLVSSVAGFSGALISTQNGSPLLIEELIFGLDQESHIYPAYFRGVSLKGGERVERDDRERASTLFTSLESMKGFYSTHGGTKLWVESLEFGVDPNGFLVTAGLAGLLDSGSKVATGRFSDQPAYVDDPIQACSCIWELGCRKGTCSSSAPPNCGTYPCPCQGSGSCGTTSTCVCPPAGYCPPGAGSCDANQADPGKCKCQ